MRGRREQIKVSKQQRAKEALALRLAGASYSEIASHQEVSLSTAHGYVQEALRDIPKEEADKLREQECMKLDRLQRGLWEDAIKGKLGAIDRVLKIMDRRARMLGLDAPAQLEVGGSAMDLDAAVRALVEAAQTPIEPMPLPEGDTQADD